MTVIAANEPLSSQNRCQLTWGECKTAIAGVNIAVE
jgi:hypothetical protein